MKRLVGDTNGIDALRKLAEDNKDFLKYLITEARSNSDHATNFKAEDGARYVLRLKLQTGELEVQPAE